MATPADLPTPGGPDPNAATFDDGLGVRRIERDETSGDIVERLYVSLSISKHAAALRERATRLANFRHPRFPRVRGVDVSDDGKSVAVVSDPVEGVRLSELIAQSERGRIGIDVHAALQVGREVLPALATLHGSRDVTHGALGAQRLILTKLGRVMVTDHALGCAIEKLQYPRPRLWKDFRIAMPPVAGLPRFDQRADVAQVAIVMLELILGRPLAFAEFPEGLKKLVASLTERLGSHAQRPMTSSLRAWFEQALPVDARKPLGTALDAQIALEDAIKRERAYAPDPGVLRHLATRALELVPSRMPAMEAPPAPAPAPLHVVPPAAVEPTAKRRSAPKKPAPRRPTPEEEEADEIAFLERELARLAAEEQQAGAQAPPAPPVAAAPPPVTLAEAETDALAPGGPIGDAIVEVISETPRFVPSPVPGAIDEVDAAAVCAAEDFNALEPLPPIDEAPLWCLTPPDAAGAPVREADEAPDVEFVDRATMWLDFGSMHVSRQVAASAGLSVPLGIAVRTRARSLAAVVASRGTAVSVAACTTLGAIADAARRYRDFAPAHAPFVRARDLAEPSAPWILAARSVIGDVAALATAPVAAARPRVSRLARALTVLPFVPQSWRPPVPAVAALVADTLASQAYDAAVGEGAVAGDVIDYRDVEADPAGRFARAAVVLTSEAFCRLATPIVEPVVEEGAAEVSEAVEPADDAVADAAPEANVLATAPEALADAPVVTAVVEAPAVDEPVVIAVVEAPAVDEPAVIAIAEAPAVEVVAEVAVADVTVADAAAADVAEAPVEEPTAAPITDLEADEPIAIAAVDAPVDEAVVVAALETLAEEPAVVAVAASEPVCAEAVAEIASVTVEDAAPAFFAEVAGADDTIDFVIVSDLAEAAAAEPFAIEVPLSGAIDEATEATEPTAPVAASDVAAGPSLDENDPEIAALLRELEALEAAEAAEALDAERNRDIATPVAPSADAVVTPEPVSVAAVPEPVAEPVAASFEPDPAPVADSAPVAVAPAVAQEPATVPVPVPVPVSVPVSIAAAPLAPAPAEAIEAEAAEPAPIAVASEIAGSAPAVTASPVPEGVVAAADVEVPRKAKRTKAGSRKKAKRDIVAPVVAPALVSAPQHAPTVHVITPAPQAPLPERVVVHVEAPPATVPAVAAPVAPAASKIVPVPAPQQTYAPWDVPVAASQIAADAVRATQRSTFLDAPMPATLVAPPPEPVAVAPAPAPAPAAPPAPAPTPHVFAGPLFESPSFSTTEHEVLAPAAAIFVADDEEPAAPRTKVHRFPVRFDARKINWKRTLAASLLLMLLESAGFAAVYWFSQPSDVGYLNVRASVDGLDIRIDGKPAGKTPLAIELPAGRHTIEMSGFGLSKVLPVEIASGVQTTQMVKWARGQKVGTLQVSSTPPGARVIIDGEMRGVTPVTIEGMSEGGHTLVLESDAGRVRQGVRVVANESTDVSVGIFAGWLNVFAPVQVRVFEDGKLLGTSEDGKLLLAPGEHRLEFINPQLGLRQQRTVEVTPGNTTTLSLDAPDGSMVVDAPDGTEVWIDGQQRGVTPMAPLNAAVGTREVILRHPQIGQRRFTVQVGVKAPARAEFFTP